MKKSLRTYTNVVRNCVVLLVLTVLIPSVGNAQLASLKPRAATKLPFDEPIIKTNDKGKIISYTTSTGKKFAVGDTLQIGDKTGFGFINARPLNAYKSDKLMDPVYARHRYVIKEIIASAGAAGLFNKDVPKTVYVVFKVSKGITFQADIENAVKDEEIIAN